MGLQKPGEAEGTAGAVEVGVLAGTTGADQGGGPELTQVVAGVGHAEPCLLGQDLHGLPALGEEIQEEETGRACQDLPDARELAEELGLGVGAGVGHGAEEAERCTGLHQHFN